jgi:replicative DNA helicase
MNSLYNDPVIDRYCESNLSRYPFWQQDIFEWPESKPERWLDLWNGKNIAPKAIGQAYYCLARTLTDISAGDTGWLDAIVRESGLECANGLWVQPYEGQDLGVMDRLFKEEGHPSESKTVGGRLVEIMEAFEIGKNPSRFDCVVEIWSDVFADDGNHLAVPGTGDDLSLAGWSDPIRFNDYSQLSEFPIEAIPGPCGEMAQAISRHCQVDSGLASSMVLATISTAIGGKVKVNLGTHREPTNIYAISVIGSGNRKSEVASQSGEPVYSYQRKCQEDLALVIREAESKRRILEKRLDRLQKDAAGKDDPSERELISRQCNDVITEMEANPVPKKPVFIVDDITPEAMGQLMADNGERMAILSAEGGIFKIISGLYSNGQANIDLFLKAHAGDFWSNNRIGRESKMMVNPALTLGLAVQPDVIEEIGKNSEFRERGLSARFLYTICQSMAGYRTRQREALPPHVKIAYNNKITSLMSLDKKYELILSPEAQSLWDDFYDRIETSLRPGNELEHLVDWGSKLPGAVARISGLLHFADSADEFPGNTIRKEIVLSACTIGLYYLEHAKAVFAMMKEDPTITAAKIILDYIKRHKPVVFKGRDLFDHTNCQSMLEILPGLNTLLERGYIREVARRVVEKQRGRPEAVSYEVNPMIFLNA